MSYLCKRAAARPLIDGNLDTPTWRAAEKSRRFVDVIGGEPGVYDTRAALLWDDEALYVGFFCEEPFPRATIHARDGLLWFENDVEVFIDGGDSYYEFELSALNTVYEVFYIWQDAYKTNPRFREARFDVLENGARTFGGNHDRTGKYFWNGSHPRGNRWAYHTWDFPGMRSAVKIDGKLNDESFVSRGWTAEIAFPWAGMRDLGLDRKPKAGDELRLFLGRYEQLRVNGTTVSAGCAFDVIGTDDNHYPEKFTRIVLDDAVAR